MFALREIIFLGFLLFALNRSVHCLLCYSCTSGCNDPFNPHAASVQKVNVSIAGGYSCSKTWDASQNVIREGQLSCTPDDTPGNGVFCCDTDLCNNSNQIIPKEAFILTLGFILIGMFL